MPTISRFLGPARRALVHGTRGGPVAFHAREGARRTGIPARTGQKRGISADRRVTVIRLPTAILAVAAPMPGCQQ